MLHGKAETTEEHCPGDQHHTVPVKVPENVKLTRIDWANSDDNKDMSTCVDKVKLYFDGTTDDDTSHFLVEVCVDHSPTGGSEIKVREIQIVHSMAWIKEIVIYVLDYIVLYIFIILCVRLFGLLGLLGIRLWSMRRLRV